MESREIKVWNAAWNMEVTEYVRSIDGADLHDAHVHSLKEDLYTFISDVSKSANGFRHRLDIREYSVAELEELCEYFGKESEKACAREEAEHLEAEAKFEKSVANLIESGAGDRETAIRWIRDAHRDDAYCDLDECIRYALGLSWSYDLDHGDRKFFERKYAEESEAA